MFKKTKEETKLEERPLKTRTVVILSLLEGAGAVGIWFLLRPGTWGERFVTLCIILIYLVIIAVVTYLHGKKVKDRPKS